MEQKAAPEIFAHTQVNFRMYLYLQTAVSDAMQKALRPFQYQLTFCIALVARII